MSVPPDVEVKAPRWMKINVLRCEPSPEGQKELDIDVNLTIDWRDWQLWWSFWRDCDIVWYQAPKLFWYWVKAQFGWVPPFAA